MDCGQLENNYKSLVDHHIKSPELGAYICRCHLYYSIQIVGIF